MRIDLDKNLLPKYGLGGEQLDDKVEFFAVSDKIGEVLYGFSNFYKNSPLKDENKKSFFGFLNSYDYQNILVGTEGFVTFKMRNNVDNIKKTNEILFTECTDAYFIRTEIVRNYIYEGTEVEVFLMNRNSGKIKYSNKGTYNKKENLKKQIWYKFPNSIEKVWTLYLSNTLEDKIKEKGYISFSDNHRSFGETLRISENEITFFYTHSGGEIYKYKKDDIARIYVKDGYLYVEHKNFKRGFLGIFNSGNRNSISLAKVSNRLFLFNALEKLGYSLIN